MSEVDATSDRLKNVSLIPPLMPLYPKPMILTIPSYYTPLSTLTPRNSELGSTCNMPIVSLVPQKLHMQAQVDEGRD